MEQSLIDRLEATDKRYMEVQALLSTPEVFNNVKKLTTLGKEMKDLEKIVLTYREIKTFEESLEDLEEMKNSDDEEMRLMATEELHDAKERIAKLEEEINILLIPTDPNDEKNVVVEIRGAAGGDEANIFAGDLFRMYSKYAESRGWKLKVLNSMPGDLGGFSQIEFKLSGEKVYSFMKYESGAHRVQRVPQTESMGRVHTSTSTVVVMPEAEEIDFQINPGDLKFDTFCSSGPGGQSVNTTKSAVRVTYIPTGLAVACQQEKDQHENKASALALLKTRLYNQMVREKQEKEGAAKRELVGNGDRSEKIRTYNYPQNRVTDHRIGFTINRLDAVINGKLDLIIEPIINEDQRRKLANENGGI